jgi:hypothetical protein
VVAVAAAVSTSFAASTGVPAAKAHDVPSRWPYATLIERIAGAAVRLPDRRIRVDRDLVICNGEGRPVRRDGIPRWKHFTCTQSLVAAGRVGRDATFRVHVLTRTRFLITDPHYGPD